MLMLTVKKEWLLSLREGRLRWLAFIVLLLLTSAFVASWSHYQTLASQKVKVSEAERGRWLNQGAKNPHTAAHYGVYVIKPDTPLAVLDPGLSAYQGEIIRLEAHKQNESLFRRIEDAMPVQRFGDLTPGFIMQMLLPLLIILSGFHLIAGEREAGTLKQLLACGVSPSKLILAKVISLSLSASLLLLPLFIYLVIEMVSTQVDITARSVIFIASYLLYTLIWSLLTVVVSSYSASARRALVVLLIFWVVSCLLLPKLIMAQAEQQQPLMSAQEFQSRLESEVYTPARLQAIEQFKQKTLQAHKVTSTDDLPFSWAGAQLQFGEEYADNARDYLYQTRKQQLIAQGEFYQMGALASPFIALQNLSMASAASDNIHHQLFIEAAEQHRRLIQKTMNNDLKDNGKVGSWGYVADQQLWQKIPSFSFQYPKLSHLFGQYRWAIFSLLLWAAVLVITTRLATKKLMQEGQI